jgi:hypothetical protein
VRDGKKLIVDYFMMRGSSFSGDVKTVKTVLFRGLDGTAPPESIVGLNVKSYEDVDFADQLASLLRKQYPKCDVTVEVKP